MSELPQTEYDNLRVTDEDDAEEDSLQDDFPASAEIFEFVALEPASLHSDFTESLEECNTDCREGNEDNEEEETSEENVCGLDLGAESNPFDASDDDCLAALGSWSTASTLDQL